MKCPDCGTKNSRFFTRQTRIVQQIIGCKY
ncbi:hypothetical protein [Priestia megaterium]